MSSDRVGGEGLGAKQDTAIHMIKICLSLKYCSNFTDDFSLIFSSDRASKDPEAKIFAFKQKNCFEILRCLF